MADPTMSVELLGGPIDGAQQTVNLVGGRLPATLGQYRLAGGVEPGFVVRTESGRARYDWAYQHSGRRNPCACRRQCSSGCPARTTP